MFIDYTATRELVGSGLDEIDSDNSAANRRLDIKSSESISMSGVGRETQLDRIDRIWSVTSIPSPEADWARWREFGSSTAAGETFSIDLFGTKASPDNVMTVSVVKGTFKESRIAKQYIVFSFDVVER